MPPRRTLTKILRFHPEELAVIAVRAERCGRTLARVIREAELRAIPTPRQHTDRQSLLHELARIGASLATLATRAIDPGCPGDTPERLAAPIASGKSFAQATCRTVVGTARCWSASPNSPERPAPCAASCPRPTSRQPNGGTSRGLSSTHLEETMRRNARRPSGKDRPWSYSTGERGTNRVRAFDRGAKGLYVEWFEPGERPTDARRRVRLALGAIDREQAKAKAEEIALAFRTHAPRTQAPLTLDTLFEQYEREVTPTKSASTQAHDRRCFALFLTAFGACRKPRTLSRREWDRFIADRRSGRLAPTGGAAPRRVGDRIIESDLRLLNAVMNWATRATDGYGGVLLDRNPFAGLTLPKEANPRRPVISAEQYQALAKAAPLFEQRAALFLTLAHETGHRGASIRQLRWSDIDLERTRITWRGENDKIGLTHVTPMTERAAAALAAAQREMAVIGDAWIFPSLRGDRTKPMSGPAARHLFERMARRAGLPTGQRLGWHALRRKFGNELRHIPLKDLCDLGGWKNAATILTCYQQPSEQAQREGLEQRREVRVGAMWGAK